MKTQILYKYKYDLKGHPRSYHSSTFVYGPILMKICMNPNHEDTIFALNYI